MIHVIIKPITKTHFGDVLFSCQHCGKYDTYTRCMDDTVAFLQNELHCDNCGKKLPDMNLMVDYSLVRVNNHNTQN